MIAAASPSVEKQPECICPRLDLMTAIIARYTAAGYLADAIMGGHAALAQPASHQGESET